MNSFACVQSRLWFFFQIACVCVEKPFRYNDLVLTKWKNIGQDFFLWSLHSFPSISSILFTSPLTARMLFSILDFPHFSSTGSRSCFNPLLSAHLYLCHRLIWVPSAKKVTPNAAEVARFQSSFFSQNTKTIDIKELRPHNQFRHVPTVNVFSLPTSKLTVNFCLPHNCETLVYYSQVEGRTIVLSIELFRRKWLCLGLLTKRNGCLNPFFHQTLRRLKLVCQNCRISLSTFFWVQNNAYWSDVF